jgi:hypothetical protein
MCEFYPSKAQDKHHHKLKYHHQLYDVRKPFNGVMHLVKVPHPFHPS